MTLEQTKKRKKKRRYKPKLLTKRKQINIYNKSTRKRLSKINKKHKKQTRKNGGSTIKNANINANKINEYIEIHNCIEEEKKKRMPKREISWY